MDFGLNGASLRNLQNFLCILTVAVCVCAVSHTLPDAGAVASRRDAEGTARAQQTTCSNQQDSPNIVFLLADDLGYASVGYNGGGADTPNLDAMASGEHSIVLPYSYAGGPVCSPTRGTLMTGRNHNRYCLWDLAGGDRPSKNFVLPDSEVTVAEILSECGYHTAMYGKWHLGPLHELVRGVPASPPGKHGFHEWWSSKESNWPGNVNPNCACFNESLYYLGHWAQKQHADDVSCKNYYGVDASTSWEKQPYPTFIEGDDSLFIANNFAEYLDRVVKSGDGKPFFAYLAFHAVHANYVAPENYRPMYESRGYDEEQVDYYGALTALDEAVGRVRELLRAYNVSHNTLVWFTSDNGAQKGSTGAVESSVYGLRDHKGTVYEGGIRVPGIIEWPAQIQKNRASDFPVVTSDLLPTVCDILGIDTPHDTVIDGTSLMPLIRDETDSRSKSIAWLYAKPDLIEQGLYQVALRRNRYKFFALYNKQQEASNTSLYDLKDDPSETYDLSNERRRLFKSMKREFELWQSSVMENVEETNCTNILIE